MESQDRRSPFHATVRCRNTMSADAEVQRDLGRHDAEIQSLRKELERTNDELDAIQKSLESINLTLSEARGGWRTLMAVGGAGGLIGGLLESLFHWGTK